jgi:carboxyl-terminal processing protease
MTTHVQPQRSHAIVASLEPSFLSQQIRQEQLVRLSLLLIASFLLLSSPMSCEVRSLHAQPNRVVDSVRLKLVRYQAMLQLIDSYYVDPRAVSGMIDSAMQTVLAQLDPHSWYMDAKEAHSSDVYFNNLQRSGSYGLSSQRVGKELIVRTVRTGSPAERGGIMPGDRIEKIWGQPASELSDDEIRSFFKKDNFMDLQLTRKAGSKRFKLRLTKNNTPGESVAFYEMLDAITGYIYLTGFVMSTISEMKDALKDLRAQGMTKLVLDLRDNSGGLLDQAHACAELFLDKGAKLTAVKHRNDTGLTYAVTVLPGEYLDLDMVVLVDDQTASAGEILAGVLQDHDRAVLIGTPTYGKGLVQNQFALPDGGAFRLTSGRYFLPSGRCIQREYRGSDYVAPWPKLKDGNNMDHKMDTAFASAGEFKTSKGRSVYGGEGVIPEIIVSLDTLPALLEALYEADVFDPFLDDYLNYNAEFILSKYPSADRFVKSYTLPKEALPLLIKKANLKGVLNAGKLVDANKPIVLAYAKRWMCYRLFPEKGWIVSRRPTDTQFQFAIETLKQQLVLK